MTNEIYNKCNEYDLSLEQKKIWYQFIQYPYSTAYNITEEFSCSGNINVPALIRALKNTINNTHSLKVIFSEDGGDVSQSDATHLIDLGKYILYKDDFISFDDARSFIKEQTCRPFNLYDEIPIRMVITRYQEQQWLIALSFHHIAIDGWSAQLFYSELNRNYLNEMGGVSKLESTQHSNYQDYVKWQKGNDQVQLRALSHAYWCDYLKGVTSVLELPLDKKRGGSFNVSGTSVVLPLPKNISDAVKIAAHKMQITDWCFYLSTFSVILHRYSNQTDFCIGYPSFNRSMAGSEHMDGLLTNTLVLRADLKPSERFCDYLSRNHHRLLSNLEHENVQLETVINDINVTRSASCNPLYQVIFSQQDRCNYGLKLHNASIVQSVHTVADVKLDLSVMIDRDNNGMRGIIEYADQLFKAEEIEALWHHYLELLTQFAADLEKPIDLPSLSNRVPQLESKPLVSTKSAHQSLNCWFEATVAKYPERIAVEFGDKHLTYSSLNDKANSLSRELLRQGAKPGELIGLSLNRSELLLVGIIAILKTGCGYLPLDPTHPTSRIDYILNDTACRIVVTDTVSSSTFSGKNLRLVDVSFCLNEKKIKTLGEVINQGTSLAYCIYTSGSTGNPKGVLISHSNVMRLFENVKPWFNFSEHDVWTLFHSYSFDFSVWEIFGALLYGGKLVVVPYDTSRSPEDFRNLLKQKKVSVLNQTPSAFNQLSLEETMNCGENDYLEHLRYVIFGGEALNFSSLSGWITKYGDEQPSLINMYGITETTVHVTYRKISVSDVINNTGSLIGDAISDLEIAILDNKGCPVPTGIVGEMYISGAGLAIGYHNRDSLNREKFLHVSLNGNHKRYYKTGDLAKRRFDGELEYYGRVDSQVKIRGHRIELGEVENALITLPDVLEAVVLVRPDSHGFDRLKTWIRLNEKTNLTARLIKSQLSTILPSYMVPQDVNIIDSLPLTANGKIDFNALQDNISDEALAPQSHSARTSIEALLIDIWSNILGRKQIGIQDNFYALGGDSLLAVMFIQECRKNQLTLSVLDLLNHPTIAELAEHINHDYLAESAHQLPLAKVINDEYLMSDESIRTYPMTGMQEVIFEQYRIGSMHLSGIYHVQQSYRIKDTNPHPQAMLKALKMLVSSHPILRTVVFFDKEVGWRQIFADKMPMDFKFHDLTQTRTAELEEKIAAIRKQDIETPFTFNIENKALFRCNWLQISKCKFELLLSTHHGIADGWGNQVLISQLFKLYSTIKEEGDAKLKCCPNVFLEYLQLERQNSIDRAHKHFWLSFKHMKRKSESEDELYVSSKPNPSIDRLVNSDIFKRIRQVAQDHSVTVKSIVLYALHISLKNANVKYNNIIGVVSNGRKDALSDPLKSLGLFWNMLPLRFNALSGLALVKKTHENLITSEKFGAYPVSNAKDYYEPNVSFNFVNFHNRFVMGHTNGIELENEFWHDRFHYPINIYVAGDTKKDRNLIRLESNAEFIDDHSANELIEIFVSNLLNISFKGFGFSNGNVESD